MIKSIWYTSNNTIQHESSDTNHYESGKSHHESTRVRGNMSQLHESVRPKKYHILS